MLELLNSVARFTTAGEVEGYTVVTDLYRHIRGVGGQFDAVLPGRALLVESWTGGYRIVSFHSLAVFNVSLSNKKTS